LKLIAAVRLVFSTLSAVLAAGWDGIHQLVTVRHVAASDHFRFPRSPFIIPTRFGGLWLLSAAVLYVVGINSRSNGPVLLALLQLSLFLLCLFVTHEALQAVELRFLEPEPSCADEPAPLRVLVHCPQPCAGLRLRWLTPVEPAQRQQVLHLTGGTSEVLMPWFPARRGLQSPGRLLIHTTVPLGLFRCWTYWEPPLLLAIAPARREGPVLEHQLPNRDAAQQAQRGGHGSDHFEELRPLRPEEGLQRVAWKTVARGQGWYAKRFAADQAAELWLSPAPALPFEQALEHLCERLCRGLAAGECLGLLLPDGVRVAPGRGHDQLQRCLRALAEVTS